MLFTLNCMLLAPSCQESKCFVEKKTYLCYNLECFVCKKRVIKMRILSLVKTSTVDYPGRIVSTIFIGACNLNCEYCHNKELINPSPYLEEINQDVLIKHLKNRKNIIEGLCISGGEATLHGEKLIELIKDIKKELGEEFLIKLDTNGTNPDFLKKNINLFNYIAIDFKTLDYEKYLKSSTTKILESIELLKNSEIAYEVRITMYPYYIKEIDFENIAKLLQGVKKVAIQQYKPVSGAGQEVYENSVLYKFKTILESKGIEVELR